MGTNKYGAQTVRKIVGGMKYTFATENETENFVINRITSGKNFVVTGRKTVVMKNK